MTDKIKIQYVKRTQKDYSMSFKLRVVEEVERGDLGIKAAARKYGIQSHSTVSNWLRKYGNFDWYNHTSSHMSKSAEQKILELEQKIILLEKQKNFLEYQAERSHKKAILFDMMIDIAEKEFKIPIRKKSLPEESINLEKNAKKQ
jgi:transposase-like protein